MKSNASSAITQIKVAASFFGNTNFRRNIGVTVFPSMFDFSHNLAKMILQAVQAQIHLYLCWWPKCKTLYLHCNVSKSLLLFDFFKEKQAYLDILKIQEKNV